MWVIQSLYGQATRGQVRHCCGEIVGQFNPPSVQTAEESSKFSVGLMWMVTGSKVDPIIKTARGPN